MISRPLVLTQAIRLSSIMQLATGRTSWCLRTRKIDFPVQNSFRLLDLSPLLPGRRQLLLSILTFDWNFNWVSLQSWIKRWSHGQSSQSLGTNISLLGKLWVLSKIWSPTHLHSSRTCTSSWPHSVADAIVLIFLLRIGGFFNFNSSENESLNFLWSLNCFESSMPLPPWTRRTRALITLIVMGFPSYSEYGIWSSDDVELVQREFQYWMWGSDCSVPTSTHVGTENWPPRTCLRAVRQQERK